MFCVLIVILWTAVILGVSQQDESFCGPLKVRLSEYDACYAANLTEVPCPEKSKKSDSMFKVCRPPYSRDIHDRPILNVSYVCWDGWFPQFDNCQSDCGRPTANNKYPWIAAIYDKDEELKCTGTIISAYHVLTALSCFNATELVINYRLIISLDVSNYTIVAGKHFSNIRRKKKSAQVRKGIKKATVQNNYTFYDHMPATDILLLEVDKEFEFFDDVQPACLDWVSYYDQSDFTEGNEAVAVGWDYNKDEMVPCEDSNEFNVQFWRSSTCKENSEHFWKYVQFHDKFCGTYTNGDRSTCGKTNGAGLFFKSSPWRYYLKGITSVILRDEEVTHILYTTVSSYLDWLKEEISRHPRINRLYYFMTKDRNFEKRKTGCKLPGHIKYGRFKLVFGEAYRIGAWVSSSTRILLTCTANADETPTAIRCVLGEWQPNVNKLECKRPGSCPSLLSSGSEDIFCRLNGQEVSCADPDNNTTAVIRCKPFHAISGNRPIYKCQDGLWDQQFTRCNLECGNKRVGVTTLAIGASEVIKNEYPWVVAIYRSTEQVCGGTIISKSYVLSAAHCFTTSKGVAVSKEPFTIMAGKHYRNFSTEESSAQSRKIKSLYIHDDYKGSLQKFRDDIALIELDAEFTPSLEVQPACLDWENLYEDFDFIDGNKAVVAGWGYTKESGSPSDVLKKLILPYRPKDVCVANLPEDFSHQYVVTDKICAGYKDNNMNVCQGDSGGGLYFRSDDNRFYIRGIVSLTVKTQVGGCQANSFALYTKVSKYLPWIETITRRVL